MTNGDDKMKELKPADGKGVGDVLEDIGKTVGIVTVTADRIEDIVLDSALGSRLGKLSPQAFLEVAEDSFKVDSPFVMPLSPAWQILVFRGDLEIKREAKRLIKFFKEYIGGGVIIPEGNIADIVGMFGREEDNILNLVNLENAMIMYATKNISKRKMLFADPIFVTMLRVYFAEYLAEWGLVEEFLAHMNERGFLGGHHVTMIQKEYEDVIEWEKWARIYKRASGAKFERSKRDAKKLDERGIRKLVEKRFKEKRKIVAGVKGTMQKMLSSMERLAAAGFSDIVMSRVAQKVSLTIGQQTKQWTKYGVWVTKIVSDFLTIKKNPKVLKNDDFIELCKSFGKKKKKERLNLIGLQSAMMQQLSEAVTEGKDLNELLIESPTFSTMLRLYFAGLVMKLGITEFILTILGEQGIMNRYRGALVGNDLNDLVKEETYQELLENAAKAEKKDVTLEQTRKRTGKAEYSRR